MHIKKNLMVELNFHLNDKKSKCSNANIWYSKNQVTDNVSWSSKYQKGMYVVLHIIIKHIIMLHLLTFKNSV